MKKKFLLALLLWFQTLLAEPDILYETSDSGLFSVYQIVMSLCQLYEKEKISGLEINFRRNGCYYEAKKGPNWWEYYFEPIHLQRGTPSPKLLLKYKSPRDISFSNTREQNHRLIQKYIHLKPFLAKKVEVFASQHFEDCHVIGVHYRGTDKVKETPLMEYEEVLKVARGAIPEGKWKIFVASDEEDFIRILEKTFPGKVCYNREAKRGKKGGGALHFSHPMPERGGQEAVLDCYLLARCQTLIRTTSNLSLVATFLNPHIKEICLNENQSYHR